MKTRSPATAGRLARMGGAALVAGTFLALGSGAANAVETTFVGYTDGCFGAVCTPVQAVGASTANLVGLTYTDSTFNVDTAGGFAGLGGTPGIPNLDNLGSFTLTGSPFAYTGQSFAILVTFSAPAGTNPGSILYRDSLIGTVGTTNNGGVRVDFDNTPKTFTFDGGGSFTFNINDVSIAVGRTASVTGDLAVTSPIPEPETYALFMAGLAAVGFMSRRRKKG